MYYTDKLYNEDDIFDEIKEEETSNGDELSAFEKGLLELGDADTVAKVIGKIGREKEGHSKGKVSKSRK